MIPPGHKFTSRFKIDKFKDIFQQINPLDNTEDKPQKQDGYSKQESKDRKCMTAVSKSMDVKKIFNLDERLKQCEISSIISDVNCKIHLSAKKINPYFKIYQEKGFIPKKLKSLQPNPAMISIFS